MGQVIGGSSAFSGGAGSGAFKAKAGVPISQNDAVQFGPDGKVFPVKVTDFAAVANCIYGTAQTNAATGQIIAQTTVKSGNASKSYHRQPILLGEDGSIYTWTPENNGMGLAISRYSAAGSLLAQVNTVTSATTYYDHQMFFLSNGSICALATIGSSVNFWIYDPLLNPVASGSLTEGAAAATYNYGACALDGGGFAITYQQGASPLLQRLQTFDNAGNTVLAPTTIWTRTGTTGVQNQNMARLSNGNLAIAIYSQNTVSSIGVHYGVVTPGGVSVKAFTSLDTVSSPTAAIPELSVLNGFFAVAKGNGSAQKAWIFDNAGNLQGAGFSAASNPSSTSQNTWKLLNDGTNFWMIWPRASDSKEVLTKLPVTGTGYATTVVTTAISQYLHYIDAFFENGYIVAVSSLGAGGSGTVPCYFWVIDTANGTLVNGNGTQFGTMPTTIDAKYMSVIPGGDFSFIALYEVSSPGICCLTAGKYANTSVIGVAIESAAKDALVSVAYEAGGYQANELIGSVSKSFDMTTGANISGNKGSLLQYGAVLKGL